MIGHFNEEAQALWDFARCVKPDGSAYGTAGTCRLGTRQDKEDEPAKALKKHDAGRLTQKKIDSLSDDQLKSLIENPKLYDYQRERLQQELNKRSGTQPKPKPAKAKAEPKGLFMSGKDVDIFEVEKKAEAWRKAAGLKATPGTIDWKHDRVHALTHEFLGGSDKVGKWLGNNGKSPTGAEETLVNMVHRSAALKARGDEPKISDTLLENYFRRDILFMTGRGNIKDNDMKYYYKENGEPDTEKFVKKYREMEASPGYDKLLDASHSAWSNAGDYVL